MFLTAVQPIERFGQRCQPGDVPTAFGQSLGRLLPEHRDGERLEFPVDSGRLHPIRWEAKWVDDLDGVRFALLRGYDDTHVDLLRELDLDRLVSCRSKAGHQGS